MTDADLVQELTEATLRRISAERTGEVDAAAVAVDIGRSADDVNVYHAFRELERRGVVECQAWRGGMGLPTIVRLPPTSA